jgi:hypothetical protein
MATQKTYKERAFQPFLKFYFVVSNQDIIRHLDKFQPFLKFYAIEAALAAANIVLIEFQPFLRFYRTLLSCPLRVDSLHRFQPFLRFWGSCVWLLWVFKFFFGFLSSRRSA